VDDAGGSAAGGASCLTGASCAASADVAVGGAAVCDVGGSDSAPLPAGASAAEVEVSLGALVSLRPPPSAAPEPPPLAPSRSVAPSPPAELSRSPERASTSGASPASSAGSTRWSGRSRSLQRSSRSPSDRSP
jgi:hypothetical protein